MYLCYREHGNGETAFNEINKGQMDCFSQIQRYDFLIVILGGRVEGRRAKRTQRYKWVDGVSK